MKKKSKKKSVWIQVFSTSNQMYAQVIKGFLESAKIRCSLYRNESFNAYPKNTVPTDEVEVMVPSEHFREAICIVTNLRKKLEGEKRAC